MPARSLSMSGGATPKGGGAGGPQPSSVLSKEALRRADSFNSGIRLLVSGLTALYPADVTIHRIKKRINLALDVDPLFVVRLAGPQLLRYEKQIYAKDVSFFLANDYDREIKESVNQDRLDAAHYLIPRIKEAAQTMAEPEKKNYMEIIVDMLDNYVDFRAEQLRIS